MPRAKGLGLLEQKVLEFLWRNGPATGDAVRKALAEDRALTDSTVRTVLRRLEEKQFVKHRPGRQFLYESVRQPGKVAADAVREILNRFCRGSLEELLAGMVDHHVVQASELRRLTEKIEARERAEREEKNR
jgi:BlaI family transcriptional regulator, penicillinase repressor